MRSSPSRWLSPRCERSAPAQKAGGAPVTTTAPTSPSASSASSAATISSTIGRVSELRRSGAFRVTTATPSVVSVRTSAMRRSLAPRRAGRAPVTGASRFVTFGLAAAGGGATGRRDAHRSPSWSPGFPHRSCPHAAVLVTWVPATFMSARRRSLLALVLSALVATAVAPSAPAAAQQEPSGRDEAGAEQALVTVDIDVLRADTADVNATLAEVRENVATQKQMLADAEAAVETAKAELAAAEAALAETQARLDAVNVEVDLVVVDSFVNPPVESAFEALTAEDLTEAT